MDLPESRQTFIQNHSIFVMGYKPTSVTYFLVRMSGKIVFGMQYQRGGFLLGDHLKLWSQALIEIVTQS